MPARPSIKRRLLVLVVGAVALVWLATTVVIFVDARHEIDEVLDAHLAQIAALIIAQAAPDVNDAFHAPVLHRDTRRVAFQIWDKNRLRLHSMNAPDEPLSNRVQGYSDRVVGGRRWRVFTAEDSQRGLVVHVGERADVRSELARDVAVNLLHPLLYALPLLGLLLWLAVARGMKPLVDAADAVSARDPDNLRPLPVADAPREIAPLAEALNRLFARIAGSLAAERRFTADAAHELRTPVAAIRAQAQVARGAAADEERARALDNVIAGCDRAAHLVDQLLMLARLDSAPETETVRCGLRAVAEEALAEVAPYATRKNVQLELLAGEDAEVRGHRPLLGIMLRNVIDNAARYSPPGTCVRVRVAHTAGRAVVMVTDEGPGIREADRERIFERFHRVLGTAEPGTGLGLSIVKRVAEIHGAAVEVSPAPGGAGLQVTASFRAAV